MLVIDALSALSIDNNKFSSSDRILIVTEASWKDYLQFNSHEYPGYRVSYFNGELIIVSPGRSHERIAEVINRLIVAYCEEYEIEDFPFGQTRLNATGKAGKEPDIAYAFKTDKDLPDLVVEVIFSSGDIEVLKSSYLAIGIKELWVWKENRITFYSLSNANYIEIKSSKLFSNIKAESFIEYVNRGLTESPSRIKKDFVNTLQNKINN